MNENTENFEIDEVYKEYDYFYISKLTIPIDFFLFQSGLETISFYIAEAELEPLVEYDYVFDLGSPSATDLLEELLNFNDSNNLNLDISFNLSTGKFRFSKGTNHQLLIETTEKVNKILGNLRYNLIEQYYYSEFIANLIFHQQLKLNTTLQVIPKNSDLEIQDEILQVFNLQNYNLFDFPEIRFERQEFEYSKQTEFHMKISYFDNFQENFIKQSEIPIYFEIVFFKKDKNNIEIIMNQLLKQSVFFYQTVMKYIYYKTLEQSSDF